MKLQIKRPQKPTKRQVKSFLIYCLIVIAGNAIASAGATFFITPYSEFVMGGSTGVGIFVRNMISGHVSQSLENWAVNITIYTMNIGLFILGAALLGKKFAFATAAGTVLYPAFMSLYKFVDPKIYLMDNPILAMFFGSLLFGLGIGIVVRVGASTGGTDIPPLILKKFFNWPISITMWILDFSIVAINAIAPNVHLEEVLYGVLITLISSVVIEFISPIGSRRTQVLIISKKFKEIRLMILNKLNRGVTLLRAKTGFLAEDCFVILTVISNRDLVKLRNEIQQIDPNAFLMVSTISEVRGNGFSSDRISLSRDFERADVDDAAVAPPQQTDPAQGDAAHVDAAPGDNPQN